MCPALHSKQTEPSDRAGWFTTFTKFPNNSQQLGDVGGPNKSVNQRQQEIKIQSV